MSNVSAIVRAALRLETEAGVQTLAIGREGLAPSNCTLEMSGRHLVYSILSDGGFIFLSVQPMDLGSDPLEKLVTVGDGPDGWHTICRLVSALERSGITSLSPKPIQLGQPGSPDCWVIG